MNDLFQKLLVPRRIHPDQERMEMLCSLAVLGEISEEERKILELHLRTCEECRDLRRDLEQVTMFDLTAAAARRSENSVTELGQEEEIRLFAKLIEQVNRLGTPRAREEQLPTLACVPPLRTRLASSIQRIYPVAGWSLAAALLLAALAGRVLRDRTRIPSAPVGRTEVANIPSPVQEAQILQLRNRADEADRLLSGARETLDQDGKRDQERQLTLQRALSTIKQLSADKQSTQSQLAQLDEVRRQQAQELTTTQATLDETREAQRTAESQLHQVNLELERQKSEVAHIRQVAATSEVSLPLRPTEVREGDARELFGARDLHIVDVYDVDRAGKASNIYGRVYYVNHRSLLFYAFDLGHEQTARKPVAFQAWGFLDPNSTTAENLGLFYLDDAKLDRWALRVVDPRILARIDTLFVTVEPPGGSQSPRGPKLLLASLAGPPNHP